MAISGSGPGMARCTIPDCSDDKQEDRSHQFHADRHRDASSPVAASVSISATSKPSFPYGCHANTVPSGRITADVLGDPSLAQFTLANQHVFSAARHSI